MLIPRKMGLSQVVPSILEGQHGQEDKRHGTNRLGRKRGVEPYRAQPGIHPQGNQVGKIAR